MKNSLLRSNDFERRRSKKKCKGVCGNQGKLPYLGFEEAARDHRQKGDEAQDARALKKKKSAPPSAAVLKEKKKPSSVKGKKWWAGQGPQPPPILRVASCSPERHKRLVVFGKISATGRVGRRGRRKEKTLEMQGGGENPRGGGKWRLSTGS